MPPPEVFESASRPTMEEVKEEVVDGEGEMPDSWLRDCFVKLEHIKTEPQDDNGFKYSVKEEFGDDGTFPSTSQKGGAESAEIQRTSIAPKIKRKRSKRWLGNVSAMENVLKRASPTQKGLESQCIFHCIACKLKVNSWTCLRRHKTCGNTSNFANVDKATIKAVRFQCTMCLDFVLCDCLFIKQHILMKHQDISMKEYRSKHDTGVSPIELTLGKATETQNGLESQCVFRCIVCHLEFTSWITIRRHKTCGKAYAIDDVDKVIVKAVSFRCKICAENVLCDSTFVIQHVVTKHRGMNMKEYRHQHYTNGQSEQDYGATGWRNKKILKLDAVLERLYQSATLSTELKRQCVFSCRVCSVDFTCWTSFADHKMCRSDRDILQLENFITKAVYFQCKLCSEKVLSDLHFIMRHKRMRHPTTSTVDYRRNHEKRFDFVANVMQGAKVSSKVGNLCKFYCKKCDKTFFSSGKLRKHFKGKNHNGYSIFDLYESLVNVVIHQCSLCSKRLLCDHSTIRSHVVQVHKLDMKKYCKISKCEEVPCLSRTEQKFGKNLAITNEVDDHCVFTCKSCCFSQSSWNALKQHFVSSGCRKRPFIIADHVTKKVLYRCFLCCSTLLADQSVIRMHANNVHKQPFEDFKKKSLELFNVEGKVTRLSILKTTEPSKLVKQRVVKTDALATNNITMHCGNFCVYKCTKCDNNDTHSSWQQLRMHFKGKHPSTISNGSIIFHPDLILEARYHQCHICSACILCENRFISRHVLREHQLGSPEYWRIVEKNGYKVFFLRRKSSLQGILQKNPNDT